MGLLKKLKKIVKKVDPIGSKIHAKTGGKLESKLEGKTPLSKMLKGGTSRKSLEGSKITGGAAKPMTKPAQVDGSGNLIKPKPTGGTAKPVARGGGFNRGAATLSKIAGTRPRR